MIKIATATPADIDALCSLLLILMEQESEFTANITAHKKGLEMIINSQDMGKIIKLEINGELVGMISILFNVSTALGGKAATFEDFIIAPEYRGKGYGKQLFEYATQEAYAENCKRISLITDSNNTKAQNFYRKQELEQSTMVTFRKILK